MNAPDSPPSATTSANRAALARASRAFAQMLPIIFGMLLLTSLVFTWLPRSALQELYGRLPALDVLIGATMGSVAMGHPLAGYILGGELLAAGIGLMAVTALIVSWVTVGVVQLPAEMLMLGRRFALLRNLLSFASAIAIAVLAVAILALLP